MKTAGVRNCLRTPEVRHWIGASGWSYAHWRGVFYPASLPRADYLSYYSNRLPTVELNSSFYHVPKAQTFRQWAAQTPDSFVFAVKVHRSITHDHRLQRAGDQWRQFVDHARELGSKLGVLLLQFPPSFRLDASSLRRFLEDVRRWEGSRTLRLALEFRHASWFVAEVIDLLREAEATMVIASSSRYPQAPVMRTAPYLYLRFHGPGELFASSYTEAELKEWAGRIRSWEREDLDVYAYFNNDAGGCAIANAQKLGQLICLKGGTGGPPSQTPERARPQT